MKVIQCQSGDLFLVSKDNLLWRIPTDWTSRLTAGKKLKPVFSGNWRLLGFAPVRPFGRHGAIIAPGDMNEENLRYANGKGRFVVFDRDHGTTRMWGDRPVAFFEASTWLKDDVFDLAAEK